MILFNPIDREVHFSRVFDDSFQEGNAFMKVCSWNVEFFVPLLVILLKGKNLSTNPCLPPSWCKLLK